MFLSKYVFMASPFVSSISARSVRIAGSCILLKTSPIFTFQKLLKNTCRDLLECKQAVKFSSGRVYDSCVHCTCIYIQTPYSAKEFKTAGIYVRSLGSYKLSHRDVVNDRGAIRCCLACASNLVILQEGFPQRDWQCISMIRVFARQVWSPSFEFPWTFCYVYRTSIFLIQNHTDLLLCCLLLSIFQTDCYSWLIKSPPVTAAYIPTT